jgi:hypothetical protein
MRCGMIFQVINRWENSLECGRKSAGLRLHSRSQ